MPQREINRVNEGLMSNPIALLGMYVHVPFCKVRCPFCPFYVQVHRAGQVRRFLDALKRELDFYAEMPVFQDVPVDTVYVGGGTPTALTTSELSEILDWIRGGFSLTVDAEVSLEVHPGAVTGGDLKLLRAAGFNRLSLGIQSFDSEELCRLGGRVLSREAYVSVAEARLAGYQNINLDLMYGFPEHNLRSWRDTLERAVTSLPEHLSCYAFTVEEGTPIHREVSHGHVTIPDEGVQLSLEEEASTRLAEWGYERYEVSNFSQAGYSCRHNMRYWQGQDYLGLGPSAQSYVGGVRFGNIADLQAYGEYLQESQLPLDAWESVSTGRNEREKVVFGLRLMKGVPVNRLSAALRSDDDWNRGLEEMQQEGLLTFEGGHLRLTTSGIRHADTVAVALL